MGKHHSQFWWTLLTLTSKQQPSNSLKKPSKNLATAQQCPGNSLHKFSVVEVSFSWASFSHILVRFFDLVQEVTA